MITFKRERRRREEEKRKTWKGKWRKINSKKL